MDGEAIIVGCAPWVIPASEPFDVGALRERLAGPGRYLDEDELQRFDRELRQHFLAAISTATERRAGSPVV